MVCVEEKRSFQMHSLNFWLINLNALVVKIGRKSNRELNISKTKASCSSLDHVSVTRYFCLISTEFSFSMIQFKTQFSCNDGKLTKLYVSGLSLTFS